MHTVFITNSVFIYLPFVSLKLFEEEKYENFTQIHL